MDLKDQRRYADIGTQTSPFESPLMAAFSPTDSVTSTLAAVSPRLPNLAHSDCTPFERPPGIKEHVSKNKYRYTSDPSSYDHSMPLLPSFPSSFGLQRQTSSRINLASNRSVSLPESLYDEDLHLVLSQLIDNNAPEIREQPRVVSMPASVQLHAQHCASANTYGYSSVPSMEEITCDEKNIGGSEALRSNSSTPSTPGTVVMHSLSSDQYHTPSPPPSSCDSVEFTLEDPAHMPDSFLRGSNSPPTSVPSVANKAVGVLEDDGWLTWANSPPRPIPALHGPSSLPYARCPSGAEGTIIGEPSSLPRMIWGLDPNDAVPTSHVPQPQQSRAASIKTPASNFKSRYGNHQGPVSSVPASAIFGSPHVGPRFGNPDMNCHSSEQLQVGGDFSRSMPAALEAHREEGARSNFRRTTRGDTDLGLNLTVLEEPLRLEPRFEHNLRDDSIMDYSHLHRVSVSSAMDRGFQLLPDEKDPQHQRLPENRKQEEIYRQHSYASGSRKGHPSNMIELLSSPLNLLDRASNKYSRVASGTPRLSAQGFTPSFLPTPPNSSSPQWSSVFSPVRNSRSSITGFSHVSSDISAGIAMRQKTNTTNDELSDELRRFVFENMPPVSSANAIDAFQASRMSPTSVANVFLAAQNALSSSENPPHPPGLPIPQHILLSKALEPFDPLLAEGSSSPKSAPPSGSSNSYTRSTLSNPRSIPLSRLRQKRGAIKLPTVPEEDSAEPHLHDGRLAPPSHAPRLFLRTPSPLGDRLHAQSMEEKATFGEDIKLGQARVKLPQNAKGSAQRTNLDSSQNATPQNSPKKKRLQRRKRPTKPVETGKPGFPLASEGTVSFGSSNSLATKDVRTREDELLGKGALDKHDPTPRQSEQIIAT